MLLPGPTRWQPNCPLWVKMRSDTILRSMSGWRLIPEPRFGVDRFVMGVVQAPKLESRNTRIATRYDKPAANHFAFIKPVSIRLWLRPYASAS